jgi:hypothetical protein
MYSSYPTQINIRLPSFRTFVVRTTTGTVVHIAAPFVPTWVGSVTFDSPINDVLVLAGLQPAT